VVDGPSEIGGKMRFTVVSGFVALDGGCDRLLTGSQRSEMGKGLISDLPLDTKPQ
jgi:hypothetical protein